MAITYLPGETLATVYAAFGSQARFGISSDVDVKAFKLEINNVVSFIPARNNQAYVDFGGTISSLLDGFVNPLLTLGTATNNWHAKTPKQLQNPTFTITEILINGDEGAELTRVNNAVIKATALTYDTVLSARYFALDPGTDGLFGTTKRLILPSQLVPIVVIETGASEWNQLYAKDLTDDEVYVSGGDVQTGGRGAWGATLDTDGMQKSGIIEVKIGALGEDALSRIELIRVPRCTDRTKILYWLNELGGWEWYIFTDYDIRRKASKQQFTGYEGNYADREIKTNVSESVDELRLYGIEATRDFTYHLRSLVNSPAVIDEKGAAVRVISDSITHDEDGMLEPQVTIQYLENEVINY